MVQSYLERMALTLVPLTPISSDAMETIEFKESAQFIARRNVSARVARVMASFDPNSGNLSVIYCTEGEPGQDDDRGLRAPRRDARRGGRGRCGLVASDPIRAQNRAARAVIA